MRIVIVGAGAVGSHLAERLAFEGQDVVVIESDPAQAEELQNSVDCLVINENGASVHALEAAGVEDAALLIAVTSSDAVNILACQAAARLGVPRRVARVQDPTLREDLDLHGVDVVIDPVEALTRELLLLVRRGGVSEVVEFAGGQISLFGGRVQPGAPLDGITLAELRRRVTGWDWIVAALVREGETIIGRGDSSVAAGDHVLVVSSGKSANEALKLMGVEEHPARKVFILGATRLALMTAELFVRSGIHTVLVDSEASRALDLAAKYDRLVVVQGDPTDPKVLQTEGVEKADVVLGLSGWDEVNILGCLVGKALGIPTAVARFSRIEYVALLAGHGLDAGVSTRLAAANEILRLVRRGTIHSVATFEDTDAEAIELQVPEGSESIGKSLTEIGLPKSAIVGGIVRGKEAFIPHGTTVIESGDRLIAIALPAAIGAVERLFG
ncbi:MAG TPA: Trk system potassium transporter TrkA [Acidimicrobiia bacterium]|nr:Trk system potassium transporter TrkA [Acidimicrobiia bacterium]